MRAQSTRTSKPGSALVRRLALPLLLAAALAGVRWAARAGDEAEVDLASDTAWTARLDDGPPRPIKVPGGGWNSDAQTPPIQVLQDVRDFVLYERTITVPKEAAGRVVKLLFGAVNYGAEVYLDGRKVAEHHGPLMPFEADVTPWVTPGQDHVLKVKAFHRRHYIHDGKTSDVPVGFDFPRGADPQSLAEGLRWFGRWNGQSRFAYGITKYVKLQLAPSVSILDVFVRPSVTQTSLTCKVWVTNATDRPRRVKVAGTLSSWNQRDWKYPTLPEVEVEAPAGGVAEVTLGPVRWTPGPDSYWWPNIPFREDYTAQLHHLDLVLSEGARVWQEKRRRFGFVEHAEGPFYYTVNGVRVNGFSDATTESQTSYYDSYSRAPAWLPPTKPGSGCPETWRRYLRAGMNCNRICCSTPTQYMMDTADELGFMLIPESPIWGNGVSRFHPVYTPESVRELIRFCRNHPSVVRYSLANEPREKRDDTWPWRALIDAAMQVDDTRPYVFELDRSGNGRVDGFKSGHAYIMEHYVPIRSGLGFIHGMGEHVWSTDGMENFAVSSQQLRLNDWAYFAPWSWLNFWPNFLEGMNHDLHAWKSNNHPDRMDMVDGWDSPPVVAVQRSLHPYLVLDRDILASNPHGMTGLLVGGETSRRELEVFNGALQPGSFQVKWSVHWDRPEARAVAEGVLPAVTLQPGFHTNRIWELNVPDLPANVRNRTLALVLRSLRDGAEVFKEDRLSFDVVDRELGSQVRFVGADDKTRGDWKGRYGREGYEIFGKEQSLPPYAVTAWAGDNSFLFAEQTSDVRALQYSANPPTGKDRIAAVRYGKPAMRLTVNVGEQPHRVSLYFLDWEDDGLHSEILVGSMGGLVLDRRTASEYRTGRYLTWKVRGTVQILAYTAAVAGVFFDPADAK